MAHDKKADRRSVTRRAAVHPPFYVAPSSGNPPPVLHATVPALHEVEEAALSPRPVTALAVPGSGLPKWRKPAEACLQADAPSG
jgi:hypothetical protein